MSIKVNLEFQSKVDLDFLSKGIKVNLVRVLGNIHIKGSQNWSVEEKVIIDTGNPISIIPYSLWKEADTEVLVHSKTSLYGLGSTDETALSGTLAEVTIVFKDEYNISEPIKIKAFLLENDAVPFIIGFEGVLTKAKLVINYENGSAYLEF
ncbi:hypothetical protein JXI42_00250 [bacterium]|nr:hypothetical protein [bacterium]